jgi:hypothetical protein
VRHDIKHGFALHDAVTGGNRNGVALFYCQGRVHFQIDLDPDHIAQLARFKVVYALYSRRREQMGANAAFSLRVDSAVHQIVERFEKKLPAHTPHHKAHD